MIKLTCACPCSHFQSAPATAMTEKNPVRNIITSEAESALAAVH